MIEFIHAHPLIINFNNNIFFPGSGKTVAAELAMFRVFNEYPEGKCVYIAPLKALVRERIEDWSVRFLKKKFVSYCET